MASDNVCRLLLMRRMVQMLKESSNRSTDSGLLHRR